MSRPQRSDAREMLPRKSQGRRRRTRRRRGGLFARVFLVAGIVSALGLGAFGVWRGGFLENADGAWRDLAGEFAAAGEPVYFAEVVPAEVPAAANFFADPVFAALDLPDDRSVLNRAIHPGRTLSVEALLGVSPGTIDLDRIAAAFAEAGLVDPKKDYLVDGDRVRAGIDALGLDFTPLADLAERPGARFAIDYTQAFPPLPHLEAVLAAGGWLAIRAEAQLTAGNTPAALADLLLVRRLAEALRSEPFLESQRVRRSLLSLFAAGVGSGLEANAWTSPQLDTLAPMLAEFDLEADFARALRGERAQLNSVIDDALAGRKPEASDAVRQWLGPDTVSLRRQELRTRQVAVNRAIQNLIDETATDAAPTDDSANTPDIHPVIENLRTEAEATTAAQWELVRVELACALARCRLAGGIFPDSLAVLVPRWLDDVPDDPRTGQPVLYARESDGGYLLGGSN